MEFDGIVVVTSGMVVIAGFVLATRVFPRRDSPDPPPAVVPPSLTTGEVKHFIAEACKSIESDVRMLRAEWTDVFDKFKRMEARRYAREKRAEPEEEETVLTPEATPTTPLDGVGVEVEANRRMLGM